MTETVFVKKIWTQDKGMSTTRARLAASVRAAFLLGPVFVEDAKAFNGEARLGGLARVCWECGRPHA